MEQTRLAAESAALAAHHLALLLQGQVCNSHPELISNDALHTVHKVAIAFPLPQSVNGHISEEGDRHPNPLPNIHEEAAQAIMKLSISDTGRLH